MGRTLNLLVDPFTEERAVVEVNGTKNQRWHDMMKKSLEALGKAKPNFWNDFDHYEISCYDDFFQVMIFLETGMELYVEWLWSDLFPADMIREFSEKGWTIPDDITKEQEFNTEKEIIRKIWNFYRR